MKKVFDQTVRDLKREVNKTVLKVPRVEQKVLDATSNEPWGPHGTLLADIAQASRNYHEYQMIMTVLWKRINDTGKNWRHVYKALTVLDYLVANGSERVIDEIKEHAYQISTLSDFQYIDSSGRDQGSNVRKKAQSLVNLVNDKERIIEVRQKAAANRDKFRNTSSSGGMYRPGGYGDRYDDNRYEERYGSRDEDKNGVGYGREREYGSRNDDRYDRNRDSYSRDEDRYSRDYDERQSRDEDNWGRSRSVDDFQRGTRSRSLDRDRERASDDDGQYSSRSSSAKVDEQSQTGKGLNRKFSEQNIGAPPSYEEALSESRSPAYGERDGETSATPAPRASTHPVTNSQSTSQSDASSTVVKHKVETFDEFDPRASVAAAPSTSKSADMDLLGSLTDSFSNPLAIMPAAPVVSTISFEPGAGTNPIAAPSFPVLSGPEVVNETYADPFGDSPFKAVPSSDGSSSTEGFHSSMKQNSEPHHGGLAGVETGSNFGFGESFSTLTYAPTLAIVPTSPLNSQESLPSNQDADILGDILPPSQTTHSSSSGHPAQPTVGYPPQMDSNTYGNLQVSMGSLQTQSGPVGQLGNGMPLPQGGSGFPTNPQIAPLMPNSQLNSGSFYSQPGASQPSSGPAPPSTGNFNQHNFPTEHAGNFLQQAEPKTSLVSHHSLPSSFGSLPPVSTPSKDKFETKSTVWADTLSRGLVNLNISGPKTNPLADIGVDFDSLNRKEKRMEKPSAAPVASTITMGKAMGSGSGMGRGSAGALRPPPNPMMGSNMGMGPMGGAGGGIGMGGYGGMNQPMGVRMGMGMNMGMNMGVNNMGRGMNMGMGMGQQPIGAPPGTNTVPMAMAGSYNPMMNTPQQPYGGGYPMMNTPQQPYGGGYR